MRHNRSLYSSSQVNTRKCTISERLNYTEKMCQAWSKTYKPSKASHRNIFVDHKHKLLLCVPYKTAFSTHMHLLAVNSDAVLYNKFPKDSLERMLKSLSMKATHKKFGIYNLNSNSMFPVKSRKRLLKEYYKVMVVRHPFVRLVSMYFNKVARYNTDTHLWNCSAKSYGTRMSSWLRKNHPSRIGNCSFNMFVSYFLNNTEIFRKDMHTHPQHSWCNHCDIHYDFIERLETGYSDQEYLLKNIINPNFTGTVHKNKDFSRNLIHGDVFERVLPQFQDISDAQLKELAQFYGADLALFGYEFERAEPKGQVRTRCKIDIRGGHYCC